MLPPHDLSPQTVSEQEGISLGTLHKWRREARAKGTCLPDADAGGPEGWSARDKFAAVVETAAMNEHERAEYCRSRGLYLEQLQQWRADCERATELAVSDTHRKGPRTQPETQWYQGL
jgi:transposase-like protein